MKYKLVRYFLHRRSVMSRDSRKHSRLHWKANGARTEHQARNVALDTFE